MIVSPFGEEIIFLKVKVIENLKLLVIEPHQWH
jgi:hypothetical protein